MVSKTVSATGSGSRKSAERIEGVKMLSFAGCGFITYASSMLASAVNPGSMALPQPGLSGEYIMAMTPIIDYLRRAGLGNETKDCTEPC